MIAYWLLFAMPLAAVLMPVRLDGPARWTLWLFFALFVALMIGFRHEVGGDWEPYLDIYDDMKTRAFAEAILEGGFRTADPGYAFFNWLSIQLGWGIYGVNLACGLLFVAGFSMFARRQPNPWLAWVIAIPYLVIVVVMGYSRQGVALGLIFAALASIDARRMGRFVVLVALAVLFHKSAAVMLPFGFVLRRRGPLNTIALAMALLAAGGAFFYSHLENFWMSYVDYRQESEGAAVRVAMNALPAAIMLLTPGWRRRWPEPGHWRYIALASIGMLFVVGVASTAVDRVALFLAPIQIYVWCRFPSLYDDRTFRTAAVVAVCCVYGAVMGVWLNLSNFAGAFWLPYRSVLLGG